VCEINATRDALQDILVREKAIKGTVNLFSDGKCVTGHNLNRHYVFPLLKERYNRGCKILSIYEKNVMSHFSCVHHPTTPPPQKEIQDFK